jgi:enamine deaminase RidA (YjgF/YER057c/UK114 family)
VNPKELGPAVGYAHGTRAGDLLFVAGQVGGEPRGDGGWTVLPGGFAAQMEKALENVLSVVRAEGGGPEHIVDMTLFVKDMGAYRAARKELGKRWQRVMGKNYPAMTLVEVSDLFEEDALVEIRAVAALG